MPQQGGQALDSGDAHTLVEILGNTRSTQDVVGQVLHEVREMRQGQEAHHDRVEGHQQRMEQHVLSLSSNVGAIVGALHDINRTLSRSTPPVPPCVPSTSGISTLMPATGGTDLPVDVTPAGTPAPAPADPTPRRRPGRPRKQPGGDDAKDTTKKARE